MHIHTHARTHARTYARTQTHTAQHNTEHTHARTHAQRERERERHTHTHTHTHAHNNNKTITVKAREAPCTLSPLSIPQRQGIKTELEKAKELIGDCRVHAENVMKNCGEPGGIELQKQLEDLVQLADDVNDMVRERGDELRKVYRHADQFTQLLDVS